MDNRIFFPATKRNRHCIGDILSKTIQKSGTILEIASGSGEHGVVFQKRFPNIIWQTSDPDIVHRKSISSWIDYEELNMKMPQPLDIDVVRTPWYIPLELALFIQGIIAINMIHITPWKCTESLFKESGKLLKDGQFLMLYGPFKICNEFTSQSNFLFDKSLKTQNSLWGLRDLEEVSSLGSENGFLQEDIIKMPANNFALIYRKVCQ